MEPNFSVKWASPLNKANKRKVQEYLQKMPDSASPLSPLKVGGNPWHGDTKSSTQTGTGKFKTWTTKGSVSPTRYTTQIKFNKTGLLEHISRVGPFDRDIVYKQMLDFVNADLGDQEVAPPNTSEEPPPDRNLLDGLHPTPVKTLHRQSRDARDEDIKIENVEYIGSYSWTGCENPTVIVPGAPRQWLNRAAPYNVQPDIGIFFIDQNGYRMPNAPLVPLVAAVNKRSETSPDFDFDWSKVDFVTDRNALRKLLRWVRNGEGTKDFRIDLELAGEKTVLVNRWEAKTREVCNGRTYGYNFEKVSTESAPGCHNGTGHHRIISYDLSGLRMAVRFEVDACLPPTRSRTSIGDATIDEVSNLLGAVDLASGTSSTSQTPYSLNILNGGYEAKSATIMELTTWFEDRVAQFDWTDKFTQIYISQTPHHVLAVHNRGRFSEIRRSKLSEFQELEEKLQPDIEALRRALGAIQQLVIEHGQRGRLTLVCKGGVLNVYERTSQDSSLPDHMMALFDRD